MIAGVTCHFNWPGFKRPIYNLRRFVRQMERDGLPLYGIELCLESQPSVMQGHKNWKVIRCTESSIMFQKELLLNMVVRELVPKEFDKIITLDADVWFDDPKWIEKTEAALNVHPVVQPFEYAYWCGEKAEVLRRKESIGKIGMDIAWRSHPGFAMAFRRDFFGKVGLYQYAVIGHGDTITGCGLLGIPIFGSMVKGIGLPQHQNDVLEKWWTRAKEYSGGTVRYLEGVNVWHEWHGHLKDRGYAQRPKFVENFDVFRDVVTTPDGALAWSDRAEPQMVKWVKEWFWNRKEDGNEKTEEPPLIMAVEEDPEVSACIVTCHNYGRFLRKCIMSILEQTEKFTYVVVVDDSSDDDTAAICDTFKGKVKYLRGEWRNFTEARKAGLASLPRTRFILCVDADNWIDPGYHEALRVAMEDPKVGVAYGKIHYVNNLETPLGRDLETPYDYHRLRRGNFADACSLIRTEAYEQAGGWPSNQGLTDWLLWLKITRLGWEMKLCPQAVLNYRRHGQNMQEKRKGKPDLDANVDVYRQGMPLCIVTLFSGRAWNLERFFESIAGIHWNWSNTHYVAIDNSGDPLFAKSLSMEFQRLGISYTLLQDNSKVSELPAPDFADDAKARTHNSYRLSEHIARLYAKAREHVPHGADLVLTIEDDIEVPSDIMVRFAEDFIRNKQAGVISGCVQSRFNERLIAHTGDWATYEKTEARNDLTIPPPKGKCLKLLASGFHCSIFRREVWNAIAFRPAPMWNDRFPYYDWAAAKEVNRMGHEWLLSGSVICKHWQKDGTYLTPPISQLNEPTHEPETRQAPRHS